MKKIISLLGAASLIATGGISVVACQTNNDGKIDPFYQLPSTRPENMDEVKEIIAYYWDLNEFYNDEYWLKEYPKGIKAIDSENWQKMIVSFFISKECLTYYIYAYLGYKGNIEFTTPNGNIYKDVTSTKKGIDAAWKVQMEDTTNNNKSNEWITNWYNWALIEENN